MRSNWPALLLAPSLALAELSVTYAMVTPACTRQSVLPLHLVAATIFLLCAATALHSWRNWRRQDGIGAHAGDDARARRRFIALVAAMTGALSALVVLALWFPLLVISPCAN